MNPSPQQPYVPSFISPPQQSSNGFNLNNKVSPSILLIIIILAVVFFISGLLHLLVRFLLRPPNRDPDDMENDVTALQGQLQQLFHLHDSGVDQSFIDTLPVFNYKAVVGVKDPFDCAVCLCEFEAEDKLRLLPKCSHAFHVDCIDTWLLSHSTCPLCRASLLGEFNGNYSSFSPVVLLLESGSERSGEIVSDREVARVSSCLSGDDLRQVCVDVGAKSCGEVQEKDGEGLKKGCNNEEVVLSVKLGKFRSVDNGGGEGSGTIEDDGGDARRCFSMGSFAYVMDESSLFQVPVRTSPKMKKHSSKKRPGHRVAMSECGSDSRRELFNGFEAFRVLEVQGDHHGSEDSGKGTVIGRSGGVISRSSKESFSVSKIWLRGKKDRSSGAVVERDRRAFSFRFPMGPSEFKGESDRRAMPEFDVVGRKGEDGRRAISGIGVVGRDNRPNGVAVEVEPERRAFSFRFPMSRDPLGPGESKGKKGRRTISEFDVSRWEEGGVRRGFNEDVESCNSLDSQANAPSFARRTLLWMMGRQQNKVVHSSFPSNL